MRGIEGESGVAGARDEGENAAAVWERWGEGVGTVDEELGEGVAAQGVGAPGGEEVGARECVEVAAANAEVIK